MIRRQGTGEEIALASEPHVTHPPWVHEQCGTRSEAELHALLATLDVASLLRAAVSDLRGIFVRPPAGALAWKRADPFLPARWLYDESDVVEAAELDPDIVVRVTQSPGSRV